MDGLFKGNNLQYKDKKGCIWNPIKKCSIDDGWIWAIKAYDENGNKIYRWKPQRIKLDWLERIV